MLFPRDNFFYIPPYHEIEGGLPFGTRGRISDLLFSFDLREKQDLDRPR